MTEETIQLRRMTRLAIDYKKELDTTRREKAELEAENATLRLRQFLAHFTLTEEDKKMIEEAKREIAEEDKLRAEIVALKARAEKWELRFNVRCQQADERDSEISDQFTLVANAEREARLRAETAEARSKRLNDRAADLYAALELVERHRKPGAETVELSSGEWQAIRVALNNSGEFGWKAFPALLASLGEARTRVAELEEILRDVWNQFAVLKPDGSRWAGGLSTLENVDAALRGGDQTGERI